MSAYETEHEWHAERVARNEASFRQINERLGAGMRALAEPDELLPFVCECGSRRCSAVVELTLVEYEALRARPDRFAVLPDHVFPEYENVVERHRDYCVVQKIGVAKLISESTDPRDDDAVDPTLLA